MATLEDLETKVDELKSVATDQNAVIAENTTVLGEIATKTTEIKVFIDGLKTSLPQEKINTINDKLDETLALATQGLADSRAARDKASADLAEVDKLDE